jgi:hypothetical protein
MTLDDMLTNGTDAQKAIARELQSAWANGNISYLQVRTQPRLDGSARYQVKQFKLD